MKKTLLVATVALLGLSASAQKYITRSGKINFNATSAQSPEKIEAVNNEIACALNITSGDVVFQAPVKSFKFQSALMQEHFNENYMESDKFPKAEFKGKINPTDIGAKDGSYKTTVTGKLTIHGVTKDVQIPGTVIVKGGEITLSSSFAVKLIDYKIVIPNLVADKVAKECAIKVNCILKKI
jgi:polyisoprenoid-binding protein YceI